jgi:hypothetical protein
MQIQTLTTDERLRYKHPWEALGAVECKLNHAPRFWSGGTIHQPCEASLSPGVFASQAYFNLIPELRGFVVIYLVILVVPVILIADGFDQLAKGARILGCPGIGVLQ